MLLVVLCYAPSSRSDFNYDDSWTIVHNSALRSLANFPDFLTGRAVVEQRPDAWRPLMVLSLMVDYQLFGLSPAGFHLHSVLWHLGCVLMLWVLCRRLWPLGYLALIAAVLFAVHPLHVEPVAAINYREDLLATFFSLAALALLIPSPGPSPSQADPVYPHSPSRWRLPAAAVLVICGLGAKATAAVTPLLFFVLMILGRGGPLPGRIRSAIPGCLATAAGLMAFLGWRMATSGSINPYPAMGIEDALAGQGWGVCLATHAEVFARTFLQLLIPFGLSAEYEQPVRGLLSAPGLASIALLVALFIATGVLASRRYQTEALALALLLICWLPTSGLFSLPNLRADRYAYLPSVGFCILGASLIERVSNIHLRKSITFAILIFFSLLCFQHQMVWRTPYALWSHAAEHAPGSSRAWSGLASAQSRAGVITEAEQTARRAVTLATSSGNEHMVLANILARQGKLQQALAYYQRAQSLKVRHPGFLLANWGLALHLAGRDEEAEGKLRQAIRTNPNLTQAHTNLGRVFIAQQKYIEACQTLTRAATLDPDSRMIKGLRDCAKCNSAKEGP